MRPCDIGLFLGLRLHLVAVGLFLSATSTERNPVFENILKIITHIYNVQSTIYNVQLDLFCHFHFDSTDIDAVLAVLVNGNPATVEVGDVVQLAEITVRMAAEHEVHALRLGEGAVVTLWPSDALLRRCRVPSEVRNADNQVALLFLQNLYLKVQLLLNCHYI